MQMYLYVSFAVKCLKILDLTCSIIGVDFVLCDKMMDGIPCENSLDNFSVKLLPFVCSKI